MPVVPAITFGQSPAGLPYVRPNVGAFNLRGAWDSATVYTSYDVVTFGGSVYAARISNVNVTPGTSDANWMQIIPASAGVTSVALTVPAILSVAGSPITTSGTLAVSLVNQAANKVWSGPTTGADAAPTFRVLVAADLPTVTTAKGGTGVDLSASGSTTAFLAQDASHVVSARAIVAADLPVVTLAKGGTGVDLSASGGTTKILAQDASHVVSARDLVGADLPAPGASSKGGVFSKAAVSHQFLTSIGTDSSIGQAQPAFSDISGSVAASQLPNPSASTLGGVESIAAVTHNFLTSISTSGVPAQAQPALADLSDASTVATLSGSQTLTNKVLNGAGSGNSVNLLDFQGPLSPITGDSTDHTMFSYVIPANTIQTGKGISIKCVFQHTTGSSSVTYKLILGSTTLFSIGDAGTSLITTDAEMFANGNQTTQVGSIHGSDGATITINNLLTSGAENLANALTLKWTFNVANTNAVTPSLFVVKLIQ
ncbi:MAG: hypothetical protein LAO78_23800 [Acidobacteriia bacterium]|nr:hypothetical protein [Terriglobia bacterium]